MRSYEHSIAADVIQITSRHLHHACGAILHGSVLSPVFLIAVLLILLAEKWKPADLNQKSFGVGFFHDGVWVVLALAFQGTFLVAYSNILKSFYDARLGFLTVETLRQLPDSARFIIGILLSDFLAWFQHWVKHQVPWFWQIHAVHHSQRELNVFTDFRFHYLEYIISRPIVMIPLLILANDAPKIAAYSLFSVWYPRLYHANIRSNFGWLRHIFVTPQSHRVHHSVETRHYDKNYGVIFSFWDRLFGTRYADCEEYPQTGIVDTSFPLEKSNSLRSLLLIPLRQMIYPFMAIGHGLFRSTHRL